MCGRLTYGLNMELQFDCACGATVSEQGDRIRGAADLLACCAACGREYVVSVSERKPFDRM